MSKDLTEDQLEFRFGILAIFYITLIVVIFIKWGEWSTYYFEIMELIHPWGILFSVVLIAQAGYVVTGFLFYWLKNIYTRMTRIPNLNLFPKA